MHTHVRSVGDCYTGGFLASMLKREEPEIREVRDVHTLLRADPENSTHFLNNAPFPSLTDLGEKEPERALERERVPAREAEERNVDVMAAGQRLQLRHRARTEAHDESTWRFT